MIQSTRRRRPGFTLIELLTVVAIILTLAAMLVGVAYTGTNKQIVGTGATNLVGWLKTAQAYALRDQKPYGLRLTPDGAGMVTAAQYIEQPADWVGPVGSTITATASGTTINIGSNGVDFSGGFATAGQYPIQPGDYLECKGGQIAQIVSVAPTALTCTMMAGDNTTMWNFPAIGDFRIVRKPQAMIGADMLALPNGVAISTTTNNTYGNGLTMPSGYLDIVFSPTGAVITPGLPGRDIRLWLIDTTVNTRPGVGSQTVFEGEQFIVTVAVRTGLVSIQPVDVRGGPALPWPPSPAAPPAGNYTNPYSNTQDGRSSGF